MIITVTFTDTAPQGGRVAVVIPVADDHEIVYGRKFISIRSQNNTTYTYPVRRIYEIIEE